MQPRVVELRGDAFLTASKCNAVEPSDAVEGGIEPGATAGRAIVKVELDDTNGCLRKLEPGATAEPMVKDMPGGALESKFELSVTVEPKVDVILGAATQGNSHPADRPGDTAKHKIARERQARGGETPGPWCSRGQRDRRAELSPDGASGGIPGPELSGARAELCVTGLVSAVQFDPVGPCWTSAYAEQVRERQFAHKCDDEWAFRPGTYICGKPELSGARAELSVTDDVSFIGGRSHLPTDLHIDSGIDLSALLGERAHRPRGDTRHEPAETMTPL
jgi:hypothetical protein